MTVSTSVATLMTVNETVLYSYQLAGLISIEQGTGDPGWTAKAAFGRRTLSIILNELATRGVAARFRVFHDVTLTADDDRYSLPSWVLDVSGNGAYIPAGQSVTNANSETVVTQISMAEWQGLSNRSAQSNYPSLFLAYRGGSTYQIELRVWPVPQEAGTIRLQVQRYAADTLEGDVTIDLEPYWQAYLTAALAYRLSTSSSLPANRIAQLKAEAKDCLGHAVGASNESVPMQMTLDHNVGRYR